MEKKKYFVSTPKNKDKDYKKKSSFKRNDDHKKSFTKKDENDNHKKSFKSHNDGFKKSFNKDNNHKSYRKDGEHKSFNKNSSFKKEKSFNTKSINDNEKINARYYAYIVLYNVFYKNAYSNIELDHVIRENNLNDLDTRFVTNIVYGTIKHYRLLSWEIENLSEMEPKREANIILLLSLYQLHYMDKTPDFAIINEAVNLALRVGNEAVGKYVNAVLRESQRQNLEFIKEDCKDEYEYLSIHYNMPVWVLKMLLTHYDKETIINYLESNIKEAPISLRVNTFKTTMDEMLKNESFKRGNLASNSLIYVGNESITNNQEFKDGLVSIQDESSQYVVDILDPKDNDHVLDMCAAPGSKSVCIASRLNENGKVLSIDVHEHRVNLMKQYIKELGIKNIYCVADDANNLVNKEKLVGSFDKVLLDAPCMGLGVIRRKPDIALHLNSTDLDNIIVLQARLLETAYAMLKPNGVLVYSTCSINKKENNNQITEFLAKHKDMKKTFEKQIFPSEYDSDGFYIAKLERSI